jgi:hypothetical protein
MTKHGAILLIHTKMVETTIYFCVSNILRKNYKWNCFNTILFSIY